jgi:hypothetical protein
VIAADPALDPVPINKIGVDAIESYALKTLDATPAGRPVALAYRGADFLRLVGVAAVEKEDEVRDAEVLVMHADAERLRRLVAAGEGNGPQAEAVKQRLRTHIVALDSGDPGPLHHLLNVTSDHFGYAVRRAGVQFGMKLAFKRLLKSDPVMRLWREAMPLGREARTILGNRTALRPWMAAVGWRRFGARAAAAERYVDRATDALLDAIVANTMRKQLSEHAAQSLEALHAAVMADHPSAPVARRRMRAAIATRPDLYVPLNAIVAMPVPAPVAAMPAAPAPRIADPVARVLHNEAQYLDVADWRVDVGGEDTYHPPPSDPDPVPVPEPEAPRQRTAREQALHEELMCVGAGNKPGCERWNISSDPEVRGSWDGRREGTLHDR